MAIGGKIQRFEARLELLRDGLGWTVVRVPFVPGVVWKTMIRLRVRGEVNGFAFRNSLFPFTTGGYFLLVNRAMQQGGQVRLGEVGEFVLEPDMEPRPAELPDELAALLDEEEGLRAFYDSFSESMRREAGTWVLLAKGDEARMRRAEQMAERFLFAMEGERELPPILVAAFGRRPKAKAGWEKMTPLQRRQGLMAVAYYQSPEAKAKRVEKLCEEAEKREAESRE
jgi:uncharacterized protein YdeI (YjbR/CyaY-like superfamily)